MVSSESTRRILVGLDGSESGDLALVQALEFATTRPNVEVHLIHVVTPPVAPYVVFGPSSVADALAALKRRADREVAAFLARHPERTAPQVVCHVDVDEPAHGIAQLAGELGVDLILVGTHGRRAAARLFLGSIAEAVVRRAPCPVLVVRPKAGQPHSNSELSFGT